MRQPTLKLVLLLSGAALFALAAHYGGRLAGAKDASPAPSNRPSPATHPGDDSGPQAAARACDSMASCYRDTARVRELDYEPGRTVDASWVIFGGAGDSLELSAGTDVMIGTFEPGERVGFAVSARYASARHQERDRRGSTASYVRFRIPQDGVVALDVSADERGAHDSVVYTLQVRRIGRTVAPSWLRATGQSATLTLASAHATDRFVVSPLSADWTVNPARWTVPAGRHKVALVPDSLYVVCTLPCAKPDTVRLVPSMDVTRRY